MKYFRPVIQDMHGYTPGEQPQAGKFIKLNTNENPYPPSEKVTAAIQHAVAAGLQRYPDPSATAFRIQAAELLGVEPDWILCGNGSDDILTIVTRALVGEGQTVRYPTPSYTLYPTLAQIQGAVGEEVAFLPDWSLPDAFGEPDSFGQPGESLRLAFIANPNSPSGTVISPEVALSLAQRLPCPLLMDEAYVDFADADCVDLVRRDERVLVSRSLSKAYSLAGLRFGFLVAQPGLIEQFHKVRDSYNCDSLAIAAATAAISDQAWLTETRGKILATRQRLAERLVQLGFDVVPSQANFVWCRHREADSQRIYQDLKARQVLVRYMNYPQSEGLRISVGTDAQIDAMLTWLQELV